jgi:hypothetical protein
MSISSRSSVDKSDESFEETSQTPPTPFAEDQFQVTNSLEDLQTEEQRRVLNTVSLLRKCGLESVLPLPQLVVCGDQSAGKSKLILVIWSF